MMWRDTKYCCVGTQWAKLTKMSLLTDGITQYASQ